jgi:D-arginine dehydrogenase
MADRFDAIVIGGGIAGAAAAFELAASRRVVLLEMEATCGRHSTGRSAALFTECYGDDVVRRLARAGRPFMTSPPSGFTESPILSPRPTVFIATEAQRPLIDAETEDFQRLVTEVFSIDGAELTAMCPVLRGDTVVGGVVDPTSMDIDVHALHAGFLAGARNRGADIRTSARVEAIQSGRAEWHVRIGRGDDVAAPVVVNAAGAWCDEVARLASVGPLGLQPKRRTVFTFDSGVDHGGWPMVVDIGDAFYFKPEGPHVLASPADETPMEPHDVRHDELDVALGIDRINAVTTLEIRHVKSAWAGLRSFVADRRPVAGFDVEAPGFFWLAGQGGYGIKTAPALGRATASLVAGGELPDDLVELGLTAGNLSPARLAGHTADST